MIRQGLLIIFITFSLSLSGQTPDTLKPRILKQWSLSPDFSEEVKLPFDTVFSLFNRYRLADMYSPINASMGNYGLPTYQINFFDRISDPDKFLYSSYYPFVFDPGKPVFMNTQIPFTEMVWTLGGPRATSEQTFRIRHSQNVNRFLNFGLIYDIVYSLGQYNYQRAEDKSFTFFSSYTGTKYKLYFATGINTFLTYENGGITSKDEIEQENTRDVPVKLGGLNKASNLVKNRNILLVQRYTFGGSPGENPDTLAVQKHGFLGLSGTFSHIFTFETNSKIYSDKSPSSGFYDTVLISQSATYDSIHGGILKNTLRFDFTTDETRSFRLGGGAGLRNENYNFYTIVPAPYLMYPGKSEWVQNNNVLLGRLYNNIGEKFSWKAYGELYLSGYRAGDFNLHGAISKSFDLKKGRATWLINGDMINRQPSFWYERWGGNNFGWQNNFNKELRIDLGTSLLYPARKTALKFNYAIIDNYTDFDINAHPSQFSGGLSVAALTLSKEFILWKFHLNSDVVVQKSSNTDILDLPIVALRSAAYLEHLFRFKSTGGKLNAQLGLDVTYHTLYHPYTYMPATGRFYRQDETTTGDYPFMNVFLNLKVKRTRLFLMFDHINQGFMGDNYDMIPSYLVNVRMFRYGLAWTFYN